MFDHLSLGVRDITAARRFYDAFLGPLGHAVVFQREGELAYGPGGKAPQLFLYAASGEQVAGLGTHIAFSASGEAAVDQAFAAACAKGRGRCVRRAAILTSRRTTMARCCSIQTATSWRSCARATAWPWRPRFARGQINAARQLLPGDLVWLVGHT